MTDKFSVNGHHTLNGRHPDDGQTRRRRAADTALGIVRADGGEPSPEVRELIERSVAGELTPDEVVEQTLRRYRK